MSATHTALRVLYVEDSVESFEAVRIFLESAGYESLPMATSLQEAAEKVKTIKPDVVLVDLGLAKEGYDLSKVVQFVSQLKQSQPKLSILVHSAETYLRVDVVRAIVAEGISYLIKENVESPEHLDRAIQHARSGGAVYDNLVVARYFAQVATGKAPSLLTEREWDVARLIALESLTNRQIANSLCISPARVNELVSSILSKLGFSSRVQIATWYLQEGPGREDAARIRFHS
jgi:DNA-binding NarL/FixJ family response regulator